MSFEYLSIIMVIFGSALSVTTVAITLTSSLLLSIILLSGSSILIALCYLCMDAPDVAMTEVAIGACLSTVILLSFARKIGKDNIDKGRYRIPAMILCIVLGIIMLHAGADLGLYGSIETEVHSYINQYFINETGKDIGIPSFVAAILASYRGYDTLGETTVILTAAFAVAMILGRKKDAK